jgi:hypothetical protein
MGEMVIELTARSVEQSVANFDGVVYGVRAGSIVNLP